MLTLVLGGSGYLQRVGTRLTLGRGSVCFAFPTEPGVMYSDRDDPYDHLYCRYAGAYADYLTRRIVAARGAHFRVEDITRFADGLLPLPQRHRSELPGEMGPWEIGLARVLTLLASRDDEPPARQLRAQSFLAYVHRNLTQPIHLDRIAREFQVSRSTLCRVVARETGKTVVGNFEEARIEQARALLRSGAFTVAEVGYRVGYEDPFYFSKVFKKQTGLSPKHWAARERDGSAAN